jgi:hypothetical protein
MMMVVVVVIHDGCNDGNDKNCNENDDNNINNDA